MRAKALVAWAVSISLLFAGDQACATDSQGSGKAEEARKEFLEAQVLLTEKKYEEAYAKVEKLIAEHAGDHQIGLYVSFYAKLFRWVDAGYRGGQLRPEPPGIRMRIEKMMQKEEKNVLDLVRLSRIVSPEESKTYLKELLQRFPDSIWKDWAEWSQISATAPELYERYRDKDWQERFHLVIQEHYRMGRKFIEEHPDSYLMPRALDSVAMWRSILSKGEAGHEKKEQADEEVIALARRILREYPTAEYYCACARQRLRSRLGPDCPEAKGYTKEQDGTIQEFYVHAWPKHQRCVKEYLEIKREKASPGSTDPLP